MPRIRAGRLCALVLLLAGLAALTPGAAEPASDVRETREVAAGEMFTINLESNRTTGYVWALAAPLDEAIVRLVESKYESVAQPPGGTPRAGAPGTEAWTFRATGPGGTTIALQYVRPWERNTPPVRTATVAVTVK